MERVGADEGGVEEGVGLGSGVEQRAGVGADRNAEGSEAAEELGEEVVAVVEAGAEEVGVDALEVGDVDASFDGLYEAALVGLE